MARPVALTSDKIKKYAKQSPRVKWLLESLKSPLHSFVPRPNKPEEYDEQSAFLDSKSKCCILLGGTGCVAGEMEIFDPIARTFRRVDEISEPWYVISEAYGRPVVSLACKPHLKGTADLYRVTLSNGQEFVATLQHRVLTHNGYECLSEVLPQFDACHLPTIMGIFLSRYEQDAGNYWQKQADYQWNYFQDHHQCDGPLHKVLVDDQEPSPPQDDVFVHNRQNLLGGVRGYEPRRTRTGLGLHLLSTMDFSRRDNFQSGASENHVFCKSSTPTLMLPEGQVPQQESLQYPCNSDPLPHTSSAFSPLDNQSCCDEPSESPLGGELGDTTKIMSIEFLRKGKFYDFTVPGPHNYLLAGIFHHNSGKTIAAAVKTARHVLEVPPPRPYCPFWVVGETYDLVCQVCWLEKLSTLIPKSVILDFDWYKEKRQWPFAVILGDPRDVTKPGWVLEFKSYAQGRQKMQAASIGGYWCNEEIPLEILQEIQGRTRDYDSPGWCDFTPIELRTPDWIDMYDETPKGWKFFHLNVELNDALPEGWAQRYLDTIPEDMRETRRIGTFTQFSGSVYKEWNQKVHLVNVANPTDKQKEDLPWLDPFLPDFGIPELWSRFRAIDWGYNNPLVCLWVAKDNDGRYYIYDEHFEAQKLLQYHVSKIKERYWDEKLKVVYKQTFADPEDAQGRAEFSRLGIPTSTAYNNVLKGIEIIRKHLMVQGDGRPKLYVLSIRENSRWVRCQNLIREIRTYHWPPEIGTGLRQRNPKDAPVDKDNHALDAMRYCIATDSRGETMVVRKVMKRIRPWQEECRNRFLLN